MNTKKRSIDVNNEMDEIIDKLATEETEGKYNPMGRKLWKEALMARGFFK